ncbi:MAG: HAMP domain-containing histidine kinase [Streptococcaceae bacterium]|jgi:signal transduction histidine kinase|nr:HAMP domain-containing histidine kinase [Streptococcaceae bacterium]
MNKKTLCISGIYLIISLILLSSIQHITEAIQEKKLETTITSLEEKLEKQSFGDLSALKLLEDSKQKIEVLDVNAKAVFPKTGKVVKTKDINYLIKGSYIAKLKKGKTLTLSTKIIKNNKLIGFIRLSEQMVNLKSAKIIILVAVMTLYLLFIVNDWATRKRNRQKIAEILDFELKNCRKEIEAENKIVLPTGDGRLEALFNFINALNLPAFIYDQKGKIIHQNKATLKTFSKFSYAIDYFSLEAEFLNLLVNQLIKPQSVHRQLFFERINRHFNITITPVTEDIFCVFLEDKTETNELLEKQNQFSANVAHELKTPTTAIIGFSENLLEGIDDKELVKRFAAIINHEAARLNQLIIDIISLSRNYQNVPRVPINLPSFVEAIISDYQQILNQKNITLTVTGECFVIQSKEKLLYLIFKNLIENAIFYTPEEGKIAITLELKENNLIFTIKDSGIGISELNQRKIFDRFFRVDNTKSSHNNGTGLGLSIVKNYVTELGGALQLSSRLGYGSTFTVVIPTKR